MRRANAALALGTLALVATAPAAAQTGRRVASDFHRRALVEGEAKADAAYAVPLSQELVAALKKGGEVRLFDAAGREFPSLVSTAHSHSEIIERPVTIFNQAWKPDGTQTLTVEQTDRVAQPVNEFVFDITDEEYNVRVHVEGSQPGGEWLTVSDGLHLIRHTVKDQKIRYVHDVLRVPTARFSRYRFTLTPTHPLEEEFEPLEIGGVEVRQVVRRGSSLSTSVKLERMEDPRDPDTRHHYWRLDLGRADLGVNQVQLTIRAQDFARSASLWEWSAERGRRTRELSSTVLFHFGNDRQTEFSDFVSDAEVLVLMIDQGDDEPVEVAAARASRPRQQLRFLGPTGATPPLALYFEPDEARTPEYDLARGLREGKVTTFAELAHAALEPNPDYATPPEPRSEQVPYLLYLLVVPLVLGLGWYVARTIQRGVPEESSDDNPPSDS